MHKHTTVLWNEEYIHLDINMFAEAYLCLNAIVEIVRE